MRGAPTLPGARTHEHLRNYPPVSDWDNHVEYDAKAHPRKVPHELSCSCPTTCFNCESACGLLAYVDKDDLSIKKVEGNPAHPGSRGRNCAKGPATINQVNDPERILHPLRRVGERGGGQWEQVTWDEALDDIAGRIRQAIIEGRTNEVVYHVGRPGRGRVRRADAAGLGGRRAQQPHQRLLVRRPPRQTLWGGYDRPSPDYANAKVILLLSSHLETGHYFNPHAQRIMEGKQGGAKLVVHRPADVQHREPRRSVDGPVAGQRGRDPARHRFLPAAHPLDRRAVPAALVQLGDLPVASATRADRATFEAFLDALEADYAEYTFEFAAEEAQIPVERIEETRPARRRTATSRLAAHVWRSAAAGNLGGWQVARALWFVLALTGSIGTEGGTNPNGWDKFIPHGPDVPAHDGWNELAWPPEYPLTCNEMSILLPHFLNEGRGRLEVYFSRVFNPIWTNPDGFTWMRALTDADKVGLHVALTPTWSETAEFADYDPADGPRHRAARHALLRDACRAMARFPPAGRAGSPWNKLGTPVADTRDANPGEVWEENELLVRALLAHRPRRLAGHPPALRVARTVPARRSPSTSTTGGSSRTGCPACRRRPPRRA